MKKESSKSREEVEECIEKQQKKTEGLGWVKGKGGSENIMLNEHCVIIDVVGSSMIIGNKNDSRTALKLEDLR